MFPWWFITFIKSIYNNAAAVLWDTEKGDWIVLIQFLSGVLQGCPASAFLFTVSLDPFLYAFEASLCNTQNRRTGIMRACADDLGVALRNLRQLTLMEPIFEDARVLAGLTLKPKKCVLIVLSWTSSLKNTCGVT